MHILWLIKKNLVLLGIVKLRILVFDSYAEPEWWDGKMKKEMKKRFKIKFLNPNFHFEEIRKFKPDALIVEIGYDIDGAKICQYLKQEGIENSKLIFWTIHDNSKNIIKYICRTCQIKAEEILEKFSPAFPQDFNVNKLFRLLRSMTY